MNVFGETGENPVRARRRETREIVSLIKTPHFEKEPLGYPEKAD